MRTPIVLALSLLSTVWAGCGSPLEVAVGSNQEASLFTAWSSEDDRVEWVKDLLETEIITAIRPERTFKVDVVGPKGLRSRENWRVHILLTNLAETDDVGEIVGKIIDRETRLQMAAKPAARKVLKDVWARGQTVLILHCGDPEAFRSYIREEGEAILDLVERTIAEGLVKTLYIANEQTSLRKQIHEQYGFSVRIPAAYSVAADSTNQVVRLYRLQDLGQAQFVIVHSRPREEGRLDPEWGLRFRDAVVVHYNKGDRVDYERSSGKAGTFQGKEATLLRGLWQNEEYTMGGAFETILFFRGDRFFMIDIAVFSPKGDKLPFLRELRAVATTFEAAEDEEAVSS